MNWSLVYLPEVEDDLKKLDGSQRILVLKALLLFNPLLIKKCKGTYNCFYYI
jgi:mRNA-degrading endonuclease RelE of RelBE toxin-antitoxin system